MRRRAGPRVAARGGAAIVCLAILGACGAPSTPGAGQPRASATDAQPQGDPARAASVAAGQCAATASPSRSPVRGRALDALLDGRLAEAEQGFGAAIAFDPRDVASEYLHHASVSMLSRANRTQGSPTASPVVAEALPLEYATKQSVAVPPASEPLRLEKASESKNLITDTADWLARNGLTDSTARGRLPALPEHVASRIAGVEPTLLFHQADHDVAVYGSVVGVFAPGRAARAVDLAPALRAAGHGLALVYARAAGDVLLVELARNGYAREVANKTGFIAAIGIEDGRLRWCSEPLVGNASSFVIAGGYLVSGYGFTAEPDNLFVLQLADGKVIQRIRLRSAPELVIAKGDRIFVRSYDTDYVFRAVPSAAAPPPVALAARPQPSPARPSGQVRCWIDAAVTAIDARDPQALERAIGALTRAGGDELLAAALEDAREALSAQQRPDHVLDLTTAPIVVVDAPPWEYALRGAAPSSTPAPPTLVRLSAQRADPLRLLPRARTSPPFFIAPADGGRLPPRAPKDIPSRYGAETLRAIIPAGDRTLALVYGGRYLILVRDHTAEHVFDLEAFRHPPRANPQTKEFAVQDVTYALVDGGVVYVANGGGSYAREVFGKKGFMSAIDLGTGKLIWRSQPLVANSTFVLYEDFIVTGYGFTEEPDALFVLRRGDGKLVARAPLDTAPDEIAIDGRRLRVECYGNTYQFELRAAAPSH